MRKNVDTIYAAKGMIHFKLVRTIAGQLSWASGIFPWIKSFNSSLWGALTAHMVDGGPRCSLKKRPTHLFFALRIEQAIAWLRMLLYGLVRDAEGKCLVMQKWYSILAFSLKL